MPYDQRRRGRNSSSHSSHGPRGPKQPKPEVSEDSSPVLKAFLTYQKELDTKHDRYERLVKLSRDITIESKRAIFIMQRVTGQTERDLKSLDEARSKFELLHKEKFYHVAVEMKGQDPHIYLKAYSPGMQEYIEAVSFHRYLTNYDLISLPEIQKELVFQHKISEESDITEEVSVPVTPVDYLLGIADLTGELMRVGVNSVGAGDFDKPFEICKFLQEVHNSFVAFGNVNRELPRKINVLRSSLQKVENVCYTIQIRGSEFPRHILAEMLKFSDGSSKAGCTFDEDMSYGTDGT